MTDKPQLSPVQMLDLIKSVRQHVDAIEPLLVMITTNPTFDMRDELVFDQIARQRLTRMTNMLLKAATDRDFSTVSFMLEDDTKG